MWSPHGLRLGFQMVRSPEACEMAHLVNEDFGSWHNVSKEEIVFSHRSPGVVSCVPR